jgi:Skp family chaperone for outer membrane proteins
MTTATLNSVLSTLEQERSQITTQLQSLNKALAALRGKATAGNSRRGIMSAAGRARIAAAQRARWAKLKGQTERSAAPKRRKMSASSIAKIRAAQKARWAKWRKQQRRTA